MVWLGPILIFLFVKSYIGLNDEMVIFGLINGLSEGSRVYGVNELFHVIYLVFMPAKYKCFKLVVSKHSLK